MTQTPARSTTRGSAVQPSAIPDPRRWWALWVVLAASFLALFDLFVVNVAAPPIQQGLHTTTAAVQLIIAGYSFTYALGLITGGRLGVKGPRALFLAGMTLFGLSVLCCGIASNADVLIAARLGQGVGASLMVPQVLALIQVLIPGPERPRAFAYFGATAGLGAVAGQLLGGVLLWANLFGWGWRAIFLVQLPIVAVGILAGRTLLPSAPPRDGADAPRTFDAVGAFLFGTGLAALLIPLTLGREYHWPAWSWVCLGAVVPTFLLFGIQQYQRSRHGRSPLIAPRLFADRAFTLGLLTNIAFYAELGSFFLIIAWFLQDGLGYSPLKAGLTFASLGVGFIVGSFFLARRLAGRYAHQLLVSGILVVLVTIGVGAALIGNRGVATSAPELVPVLFFVGLGNGLVLPTLLNVVLTGVAKELAGAASGVLVTMQQVGAAVGVAAVGSLFYAGLGGHPTAASFRTATTRTILVDGLLVLVTGCLIALLSARRRPATQTQ